MALLQCSFFSPSLMRTVPVNVLIPTDRTTAEGAYPEADALYPTLYLLHGIYGNGGDWLTSSRVRRWAQERGIAVVMPSGENHFYVDNPHGRQLHGSFLCEDLVSFTRKTFPLSHRREDTFIGGLSMGGYGAIVSALNHPDLFGAVCAFSSALLLERIAQATEHAVPLLENRGFYESVFGDLSGLAGSGHDYIHLAEAVAAKGGALPRFYLSCGTEDSFLTVNRAFRAKLAALGYDVTWDEGRGGHDWDYWDGQLKKALDWLTGACPDTERGDRDV